MPECQAAVRAAKTQRIRDRPANTKRPGFPAHEVDVASGIGLEEIGVNRSDSVMNSQGTNSRLNGSCSGDEMSHAAFCGTDSYTPDAIAHYGVQRGAFTSVVHQGGSAVGVHVID